MCIRDSYSEESETDNYLIPEANIDFSQDHQFAEQCHAFELEKRSSLKKFQKRAAKKSFEKERPKKN